MGYDLHESLKTMLLDDDIPRDLWRDTATARIFRVEKEMEGEIIYTKLSLQDLAMKHLQIKIQNGPHDAVRHKL